MAEYLINYLRIEPFNPLVLPSNLLLNITLLAFATKFMLPKFLNSPNNYVNNQTMYFLRFFDRILDKFEAGNLKSNSHLKALKDFWISAFIALQISVMLNAAIFIIKSLTVLSSHFLWENKNNNDSTCNCLTSWVNTISHVSLLLNTVAGMLILK